MDISRIDIDEIIHESVKLLTPLAEQKGVNINVSIPGRFIIRGDRAVLLELFVNIIDNAIKHKVSQGRIAIKSKTGAGATVSVYLKG